MNDTILAAITQHLQGQYPQLHIAIAKIPGDSNWNGRYGLAISEYVRVERPLSTTAWCSLPSPYYCFLYHRDGTIIVLNDHFQDTNIELTDPDSIQQIHATIQGLLKCEQPSIGVN